MSSPIYNILHINTHFGIVNFSLFNHDYCGARVALNFNLSKTHLLYKFNSLQTCKIFGREIMRDIIIHNRPTAHNKTQTISNNKPRAGLVKIGSESCIEI